MLRERGITADDPRTGRPDQAPQTPRLAPAADHPRFDAETYKGRNIVERSFNDLKQWRGIATRYDKLAITYRGGVVLAAIIIWLRQLGDTP